VHFFKVLILELFAIYTFSACAVALREITALDHEALDDAVETRVLVVERLSRCAFTFLAGA
jgi:hypothetical protein